MQRRDRKFHTNHFWSESKEEKFSGSACVLECLHCDVGIAVVNGILTKNTARFT